MGLTSRGVTPERLAPSTSVKIWSPTITVWSGVTPMRSMARKKPSRLGLPAWPMQGMSSFWAKLWGRPGLRLLDSKNRAIPSAARASLHCRTARDGSVTR